MRCSSSWTLSRRSDGASSQLLLMCVCSLLVLACCCCSRVSSAADRLRLRGNRTAFVDRLLHRVVMRISGLALLIGRDTVEAVRARLV